MLPPTFRHHHRQKNCTNYLLLLHLLLLLIFIIFPTICFGVRQKAPKSHHPQKNAAIGHICLFPEAGDRQFFFDIRSDTPPRSIILDTVVEPADARLAIVNVRSNNLPEDVNVDGWLSLDKRTNGQFLVHTTERLIHLPPYPSAINETLLYVTVQCNGRLYPLMTVRIRAQNVNSPEWIGAPAAEGRPVEMAIPKNAQSGTLFPIPMLTLDPDPADHYALKFSISPPHDRDFALDLADQSSLSISEQVQLLAKLPSPPYSRRIEHWRGQQFPPQLRLKLINPKVLVLGTKQQHLLVNISAKDNDGQSESRQSWIQLKLVLKDQEKAGAGMEGARFSRIEYFGNFTKELKPGDELIPSEPLFALFPSQRAGDRIVYSLDRANPYGQLFEMEPDTGRLRLAQPMPETPPQTMELDILAKLVPKDASTSLGDSSIGNSVHSKLILTDQTEVRLTYFTQCHYETHLAENPSAYTRVLHFNFKGDVEGVELLNGTDLFKVDQYGQMTVRPGVEIDRERTERIVLKARLRSKAALHPKSLELCQIATADVLIDDVNDHSPRFARRTYRFRLAEPNPFNNTEVGLLRALDGDIGEFGRVRYRILDEFVPDGQDGEEPLPFVLFQADGAATLFYVIKPLHLELRQPYKPQSEYTFTVEAFDADEDPRTARVSVNVRLEEATGAGDGQKDGPVPGTGVTERREEKEREEEDALLDEEAQIAPVEEELALASPQQARDQPQPQDSSEEAEMLQLSQSSQRRSLPDNKKSSAKKGGPSAALATPTKKQQLENKMMKRARVQKQLHFGQEHFVFRLSGTLQGGQTIGWVQAAATGGGGGNANDGKEEEEEAFEGEGNKGGIMTELEPPIEYAVEEGIAGFVGVEPATGRLFVGPHLAGDRFEEIRFTVAAQHRRDGRVLATALVSLLIDESTSIGRPQFAEPLYRLQLDLSNENQNQKWPRRLGQIQAGTVGGNGTVLAGDLVYKLVDANLWGGMLTVDPFNGTLWVQRAPSEEEWPGGVPIRFGIRACLRQNGSECAEARVEADIVSLKAPTPTNSLQQQQQQDGPINNNEVKTMEFEQFRYELDLSERTFVPQGSSLVRVSVRPLNRKTIGTNQKIHYRLLAPLPNINGGGFLLGEIGRGENNGIQAEDLELDLETGDLYSAKDLRFAPVGPIQTRQFTVQAIQANGDEEDEPILAEATILIRSKPKSEWTDESGAETRIQFIPLPKTIFLAATKPIGSTILRVSVRAQNPHDGIWHLLPLAAFQTGDGHPVQVDYSVETASSSPNNNNELQPQQPFVMRENLLTVNQHPLRPGQFDLIIRARLQRRHPLEGGDPAREEIRAHQAEHPLQIVVMGKDGRQQFPVFERIGYEFQIDPNAHFPLVYPPLNASLAGGQQIRFSLFPARSSDPTDGLEIHSQSGQLRIHQQFLDHFPAEQGGEVFLVVRAVNGDAPEQFFSDASVALIVHPKAIAPLQFDAPLYRFVLHEEQGAGTMLNGGGTLRIGLANAQRHPNARIWLANDEGGHFELLKNGSLVLGHPVDLEQMPDSSRGRIQMEVIAEEGQNRVSARVEVEVVDKNEHVPAFVPLFPEYRMRMPLVAGQPIGQLVAADQDFTDRQSGAAGLPLAFRAISGNASQLVHVQRDGLLLVKDPSDAIAGASYALLVEVRDHDGLIARTTARFVVEENDVEGEMNTTMGSSTVGTLAVEGGGNQNQLDEKGTTVDVPLPISSGQTADDSSSGENGDHQNNVASALFSVRDSLGPNTFGTTAGGQMRFQLESNPDGMFRLDEGTGELFLEEQAAFGQQPPKDEYELSVRVLQQGGGGNEMLARRVYTVRLVSMATMTTTTMTPIIRSTIPLAATSIFNGNDGAEESEEDKNGENAARGDESDADIALLETTTSSMGDELISKTMPALSTTESSTERKTRWTLRQTPFDQWKKDQNVIQTKAPSDLEVGAKIDIEMLSTDSNTRRPISSASPRIRPPSARPLTRIWPSTSPTPSSSNEEPELNGSLRFALSRYHWVVAKPKAETLVGRLELLGSSKNAEEMQKLMFSVEPPQFRQWFRIEQQSGDLYLHQVPLQLFGRQRAEFRVQLLKEEAEDGNSRLLADTVVIVDLNLPPKMGTSESSFTVESVQSTTTESGSSSSQPMLSTTLASSSVEIAENSDQRREGGSPIRRPPSSIVHGTTLTAIDTRFTVSISPMRFTAETVDDEEGGGEAKTTQRTRSSSKVPKAQSRWTASSALSSEENEKEGVRTTPAAMTTRRAGFEMEEEQRERTANGHLNFGATQFKAMLPEGRYGNSGAQLTLRPHPLAQGMHAGLHYSIELDEEEAERNRGEDASQPLFPFFVRKENGELIALGEIDREERAQYQFKVKALDSSSGVEAETRVLVQILDVNDNFPQFLEPLTHVIALGRLTPAGNRLAQFRAVDPDEGAHGRVQFRVEQDPSNGWFRLEPTTGQLVLARAVPSEEEDKRDMFEVIISALDGGRPALRTEHHVRVEVFPNSGLDGPEFRRTVYEAGKVAAGAAQNGTFVWQLSAGTSSQIEYALIDPPLAHLFRIDPQNGQIRMGRRPLDSERGRQWTLNVSATEGQGPRAVHAFTTVNVFLDPLPSEMEQHQQLAKPNTSTRRPSPSIQGDSQSPAGGGQQQCRFADRVFHTELAENTEGRQRLTTLRVVGCEGRRVHFAMHQGNDAFELDGRTGELFAIAPLDRERKSLHFLVANLSCVQSGVANVMEVKMPEANRGIRESKEGTTESIEEEEEEEGEEEERTNRGRRQQNVVVAQKQNNNAGGRQHKGGGRDSPLFNGLVEQAKSKLANNQALVLVKVLDRNDNAPQIQQLTQDGQIVFTVDWQYPVLQPIGRIQAHDPDEHSGLQFSLEHIDDDELLFSINGTTGVLQLMKSLQTESRDEFRMVVAVSDGEHTAKAPLMIYKLQPGANIALLVINQPVDQVDVLHAVRHLNMLLAGFDVDVLVKQVYIGDDGLADPRRTHLLAYAVDKKTKLPISAGKFKELLDAAMPQLLASTQSSNGIISASAPPNSPLRHLAEVYVPPDYGSLMNAPFRLTGAEITLLAISALLVFCICAMLFTLLRCCKRHQELITKSDLEYMVDSGVSGAGPRPYNVELITRKAAQAAEIAGRRLPEPQEQCTMTSESRATLVASSGIYAIGGRAGDDGSSQLGGPLRRTVRGIMAESNCSSAEETPPQSSMQTGGEQNLLLRPQRGRVGKKGGGDTGGGDSERVNQTFDNDADGIAVTASSSAENSPEMSANRGNAVRNGAPRREPPPPPNNSPPQIRQQPPQTQTSKIPTKTSN